MKKIEWWKVRREALRIYYQLRAKFRHYIADPYERWSYDRRTRHGLLEIAGRQPFTDRVAIYVLFQPNGLLASTGLTVRHLREQGWSVVVMSNAPISASDLAMLLEDCAAVVERPNVGYDFGAYREGLRWLNQRGIRPERLVLMNDSTWFPLRRSDDTLCRLEALDCDLAGHVYKIESTQKRGRDHIESHLLMFSRRALEQPAMQAFWRSYVMSSDREITIQYGEKGVSQCAIKAGLKVGALYGRDQLHEHFSQLNDADLQDVMQSIVHHRPEDAAYIDSLVLAANTGRPWRQPFLDWVWKVLSNSRQHLVSVTFVEPTILLMGLGFVKKARDRRANLARIAVLRLIDERRIDDVDPVLVAEIEQAVKAWTPLRDWRWKPGEHPERI